MKPNAPLPPDKENSCFGRCVSVLGISLVVSFFVWLVVSWPLPRYVTTGIPSSSQNIETPAVRTMIAGDQLQLLYHFWLFADMVRGAFPLWLCPAGGGHARPDTEKNSS